MRIVRRLSAFVITGLLGSTIGAAAQTVGPVVLSPTTVPVGAGTPVTVTATITDPSVVAGGALLQRYDSQGRVIAALGTLTDDGLNGDAVAGDRRYSRQLTVYELAPGPITLRVSVAFQGRIVRVLSAPVTLTVTGTASTITIATPVNFDYRNVSPIVVTGTVGDTAAQVRINGVEAAVNGLAWTAQVPILEGTNTLTAVATNTNGTVTTASVQVTLDTTPPKISINAPEAGGTTSAANVAVSGLVNDIVVGTVNPLQATVTVNGAAAQVANRSFLVANVPLALGPNTIQATATDRSGNSATSSLVVTRVPANGAVALVSGNNQSAPTGSVLPQPLVARITNALGQPVAGVPVVFRVVENSGGLVSGTGSLGSLAVPSDAQGQATASFRLGTRSGVGNNVVEATATGFAGAAVFTHSATPTTAQRIVVDTGNGQIGAVGQALALPFVGIVTDAGFNRIGGVPITFIVKQGGGTLNGPTLTTMTTTSDADGRVAVVLTLGRQEGQDNNVVEATFAGNPGLPAAFLASGKVPADPVQTRITGVVLDNANHAIAGVTMRMFRTHQNTGLPEAVATPVVTGENGQFSIQPAPVGAFKLMADGSTAPNGPWPTLEFDVVTIAGQTIDVGLPIYLPVLDAVNRLCVSETTGGTLTLPDVPGFSLTLAPGSATFPGGSRTGCVSVTPVNGDKVPMSPGFGQQPRFVVTIQPVGTMFNPAARLTLPNVDGLAPRQVTEMYSYDHDLAAFVSIGTGTVSEDGSIIATDPGVGVIKAGWHCGGNPNPTGSAGTCPSCKRCQGTECVTDNSRTPPQTSSTDCRREVCQGGSVTSANNDGETPAQASATDCRRQVCQNGSVAAINSNSEQPTNVCEECQGGAPTGRADGATPADTNACCFQGQRLNKFGQELGILFDGPLATQCPQRTQNATTGGPFGNGLHSVDGCSGGIPPNTQDPMQNLPYPFGLFNQAPTPFGLPIGGGLTPVTEAQIGGLPCNQHDLCYQSCVGGGASQTSAARASCDDAMETRMDAVCEAAYPSTCPSTLGPGECASFHLQRADCFTYSGLYRAGLEAFGGPAFNERQTQFCQCCP